MKWAFAVVISLLLLPASLAAQLKTQSRDEMSASRSLIHPSTSISSFLGLLSSDNFMMRHSVSMSYVTSGGQGISLADYTNSMFFKLADPLNMRFDVTLQGSPFGQYGSIGKSDLNGVFLSRAELNYHPSRDFMISLQYQRRPYGGLSSWYDSPFSDHRWGDE